MKKNSFLQGTIIASIAIIFIKILGALYVIPFYKIIGEQGGSLYSYAYNIYNLFLTISITGFPIAISKIVGEYNEKGMFNAKETAFKLSKFIVLILGFVTFLIVFIFSNEIATLFIGNLEGGNDISSISFVIKAISFSLLIIPYVSILRGYLQGHKYITPSTNSQIIEQILRIAVVLLGSYLAINVFNKDIKTGVAVALSGAFIGGLGALIYLNIKIRKNKKDFIKKDESNIFVSSKEIVKKIFIYSLPSIIISIVASLYDTTDQILVIRGASLLGFSTSDAETMGSIISTWGVKICMIVAAIGMAISINTIPHMVSSYINKDYKEVSNKLNQILKTALVIMTPMSIGVSILAKPLYTIFYGESLYGPLILSVVIFASLLANLNNVLNTALIGISEYKIIYINTILGVVLNLLMDIPFMIIFDKLGLFPVWGASFSSILSFSIATLLACTMLKQKYNISFKDFNSALKKVIISCVAFSIPLIILNIFVKWNYNFIVTFLIIVLYMIIGASIYIYINCKNGLIYDIFGKDIFTKIKNKLKLGKEN